MTRPRLPRLVALAAATLVAAGTLLSAPAAFAVDSPTGPASGASRAATASSALITPGSGPLSVTVLVPLTVDAGSTGLLTADELAVATAVGGELTRQVDAIAATTVVVGLDPMIVASIRVLGTSAPPSATEWLARLQLLPNEIFLLGYADADPLALANVDAMDVLSPLGFEFAIDPADFGPAVTPAPTASDGSTPTPAATPEPSGTPGEPTGPTPLPTDADLLAWPTAIPAIAWPADEVPLTDEAAAHLASAGYSEVVVDSAAVSDASQALVDLGGLRAITTDENLSDLVRRGTDSTSATLAPTLVELGAALEAEAVTSPGRTVVATLDRGWWSGTTQLAATMAAIDSSASAQLVSLGEVLAGTADEGTITETNETDERAPMITQLVLAERAEQRYLTIAETPLVVEAPRRLELLALLGTGWSDSVTTWTTAGDGFLTRSDEIRSSVQIVESTDVFLPGDNADLPISVSNALPVAVTVYVTVTPLRPLLHVRDPLVAVTVDPDSTNRAKIPVQAIANGDVTVRTSLAAADGTAIGASQYIKIILQAGWETAGTIVAGALIVLVFGGGLVRNVLKRRRGSRREEVESSGD